MNVNTFNPPINFEPVDFNGPISSMCVRLMRQGLGEEQKRSLRMKNPRIKAIRSSPPPAPATRYFLMFSIRNNFLFSVYFFFVDSSMYPHFNTECHASRSFLVLVLPFHRRQQVFFIPKEQPKYPDLHKKAFVIHFGARKSKHIRGR